MGDPFIPVLLGEVDGDKTAVVVVPAAGGLTPFPSVGGNGLVKRKSTIFKLIFLVVVSPIQAKLCMSILSSNFTQWGPILSSLSLTNTLKISISQDTYT